MKMLERIVAIIFIVLRRYMSTVVPGVHQSGAPPSSLVWWAGEDQVRDGLSFAMAPRTLK